MTKRSIDGRIFTILLALAFSAWVWFFFWAPNRDAARELLDRRTQPVADGELSFALTVRVTREGSGRVVPGAAVEWQAPSGASKQVQTGNDGQVLLRLPSLGRYRLRVLDNPAGGHGPKEIPYRYKIGAEREPVTISVPARSEGSG
jgi:uncharacterized protein (DUF58 family)